MIKVLHIFKRNKKKNIKEIIFLYIKNFKNQLKSDMLFVYFIIGALINSSLLRFFTVKNYFDIKPIIADLIFILIVGIFSYLIKKKNRFTYFMVWSIVTTLLCFINSIYYTFYSSFVSVSLLSTSVFVVDVGDAVIKNVLTLKDFSYLWFPIMLFIMTRRNNKHNNHDEPRVESKKKATNTLIATIIFLAIFIPSLTPVEFSRFNKQWNREFLVAKFGLYVYHMNDLVKSVEPRINTMFGYDKAAKSFRDFYATKQLEPIIKNKYTNIYKGMNIIAIHAESIQSFAMNLKFNGLDVTPNLNRLAKEGMNFTNFYTQVGVGTSSDTEFTLNTSILPICNGTVFVSYWNREFITIPKLLDEQGYYSFSMHGNNGTFWNRLAMHKEMGYDTFFHKTSYVIDDQIGLGLADKSFFRQSIPIIKQVQEEQKKPFYATLIMLSNHTPFDEIDKYGDFPVNYKTIITNELGQTEEVTYPYMEDTIMGRYLKSVHYSDAAIGEFINGLDQAGLLDNTVVVIYGDHDARLPRSDYVRLYNYDYTTDGILDEKDINYKPVDYYQYELDRKVPFIIWSKAKPIAKKVNTVMGMYDVLPTLGNMFGFRSEYQLGSDIFNVKDNIVVFTNSNWITNKVYYNSQKSEYLLLKDEPLEEDYIAKHNEYADKLLEVSNSIILYDLIRKEKELNHILQDIRDKE